MTRRRNPLADRLARLEAANRADRWHFTLTDGSTATLPIGAVLDAIHDAIHYTAPETDTNHRPAISRELHLLARVADDSETSMLGHLAVDLARNVVEGADGEPHGR
ncbi:hypothetical protein [Streptomyces sp. 769]|uniref:hypothetical protein n=1 Tax=Streptomyces sp. 769 TaxID=1262452 RepID=UPI00057E6CFF|nr:hypothetical protein [Streptomyces sp. 769]AJC60167.1 hypothetical protein GZL_07617 [Streptomyces sp. 769]